MRPADPDRAVFGPVAGSYELTDLVDAVVAMSSDHELPTVLTRVVRAARELTGARYAALGVLSETAALLGSRRLAEFLTDGIDAETAAAIGELPRGQGVLGVLIDRPEPLLLAHLADHPASVGFPVGHPPMTSFLGVPVRAGRAVFGNLYLTDKRQPGSEAGAAFDAHDVELATGLAAAAGVAIENARLLGESRTRQRWSAVTATLIPDLVRNLAQVPLLVARGLVQSGSCDAAGIALAEDDQLDSLIGGGRRGLVVRRAAGLERGLLGRVIDDAGRARVLGAAEQERVLGLRDGTSAVVAAATAEATLGALVLHRRDAGWSRADLDCLDSFAADVARAVDHARHQHNGQLLAVYTDRDRIARDLHDQVIQRVFAVGLGLQGSLGRVSDPAVRERLVSYVEELDATIAEIRSSIFALDSAAGRRGLGDAVRQVVQDSAALLGFEPRIRMTGPVDDFGPAQAQADVLAAVREGLANVARHARARLVEVDLSVAAGWLVVRIDDDGRGLPDLGSVPESGLANVRTRAALLGGDVAVGDRPGGGTRLTWRVPVTA